MSIVQAGDDELYMLQDSTYHRTPIDKKRTEQMTLDVNYNPTERSDKQKNDRNEISVSD